EQARAPGQEVEGESGKVEPPGTCNQSVRASESTFDIVIPEELAIELTVRPRPCPQVPRQDQGQDQRHAPPEGRTPEPLPRRTPFTFHEQMRDDDDGRKHNRD